MATRENKHSADGHLHAASSSSHTDSAIASVQKKKKRDDRVKPSNEYIETDNTDVMMKRVREILRDPCYVNGVEVDSVSSMVKDIRILHSKKQRHVRLPVPLHVIGPVARLYKKARDISEASEERTSNRVISRQALNRSLATAMDHEVDDAPCDDIITMIEDFIVK